MILVRCVVRIFCCDTPGDAVHVILGGPNRRKPPVEGILNRSLSSEWAIGWVSRCQDRRRACSRIWGSVSCPKRIRIPPASRIAMVRCQRRSKSVPVGRAGSRPATKRVDRLDTTEFSSLFLTPRLETAKHFMSLILHEKTTPARTARCVCPIRGGRPPRRPNDRSNTPLPTGGGNDGVCPRCTTGTHRRRLLRESSSRSGAGA